MRLYAPAKINWTLEVLGRPDSYRGYHEIRTVLQTIDLADVIEVWPAADLRLEVIGPHQASEDDLVLKAARLLQEESGHRGGALIRLTKRIPVAAGLGGGSSDAAAVLRGLNQLWGLSWSNERLALIAAVVSSDATFFLYGGTALAQGRGERIAPLPDVPPTRLVLVVPPWSLPDKTARMYQGLVEGDFSDGSRTQRLVRRLQKGEPPADSDLCNAFQRLAYQIWPGLAQFRDTMLAGGARRAHLAGSGPALFALAPDERVTKRLQASVCIQQRVVVIAWTIGAAEALRSEV